METQGTLISSLHKIVVCCYAKFYLCAHLSEFRMSVLALKIIELPLLWYLIY